MVMVVMLVIVRMVVIVVVMMIVRVVMVMMMPGFLRVGPLEGTAVCEHAEAGSGHTAPGGLPALDRNARQAETGHGFGKDFERKPQVQAGPEKHVSGDAAAAIQVVVGHGPVGYHACFSRKDAQRPLRPMITWSWSFSPTTSAASSTRRVNSTSSGLGVGSPLGWVWKR